LTSSLVPKHAVTSESRHPHSEQAVLSTASCRTSGFFSYPPGLFFFFCLCVWFDFASVRPDDHAPPRGRCRPHCRPPCDLCRGCSPPWKPPAMLHSLPPSHSLHLPPTPAHFFLFISPITPLVASPPTPHPHPHPVYRPASQRFAEC